MEDGFAMILHLSGVRLSRGNTAVLRGVDFSVDRGEIVALMGLSGGGKTTVLRAITALEPFDGGTIEVDGVRLDAGSSPSRATIAELRRRVGMVFQLHYLFDHLTALQNVTLAPLHVAKASSEDAERTAVALLEKLGVAHRGHAYPRELSGGEAQRVAIARAMAMEPPLLLMDEPTASLDPERRTELQSLVKSLAGRNRTLLVATHDLDFAEGAATRVLYVRDGRITDSPPRR